ncbi:hypothetical protein LguiB_009041 [Lonicera macranthoides]
MIRSTKITHGDEKSTNNLLDERLVVKISDFGLSKMEPTGVSHTHMSTMVKGSFGYLDPEYYQLQRLTDKSDVYSFGVVLFEVLSGKPAIIDLHVRDQIAPACLKKFADVAYSCVQEQGINRPSMSDMVWSLELVLQLQEAAENMSANGAALDTLENFTNLPFHLREDTSTEHDESLSGSIELAGSSRSIWAQDSLNFFDNTLDIVHSTLFRDGFIGIGMLKFVLFDWNRGSEPQVTSLYVEAHNCMIAGRWMDLASLMRTSADLVFLKRPRKENPYSRFYFYMKAFNLAANGKIVEHVILSFRKMDSFLKEWNIGIQDQRELFLSISNIWKEQKSFLQLELNECSTTD